ncbi:hypothetical protein HY969_01880 [Candidatus Kaiserbacteria bacterium]|nr:hypothetical protein [Candidatus Kaiserbacteria bacterium]
MARISALLAAVLLVALALLVFENATLKRELRKMEERPRANDAIATSSSKQFPSSVGSIAPRQGYKHAIATVFWVGEGETEDNAYISNSESAFDGNWLSSFGGVDDPECRNGFHPCLFTPRENPFYIALPYSDLDEEGNRKENAFGIPWFKAVTKGSLLKDRWVEVRANGTSCYAQWEDVGPFGEDDFAYVFGTSTAPQNTYGEGAGIDLSPAMRDCIQVDGSSDVEWRHVDASAVPEGPWKEILTH